MAITLAGIELPDDLDWVDEFDGWSAVERSHTKGATGKLIIQAGALQEGRPLTLASESQGSTGAWCQRSVVEQIQTLTASTSVMTLVFHSRTFSVVWAPDAPFTASQIIRIADPDPTDFYAITIKLIEVSP